MENNTTTFDTSMRLKEAGFPQKDTEYIWNNKWLLRWDAEFTPFTDVCAAPTAQELADELPFKLEHEFPNCLSVSRIFEDGSMAWSAGYEHEDDGIEYGWGSTQAEALAALWLKLHEASSSNSGPEGQSAPDANSKAGGGGNDER